MLQNSPVWRVKCKPNVFNLAKCNHPHAVSDHVTHSWLLTSSGCCCCFCLLSQVTGMPCCPHLPQVHTLAWPNWS